MTTSKKQAIVQSLDTMTTSEMEQVMHYIKEMLYNPKNEWGYMMFKKSAMEEIEKALQSDK